MGGTELEQEPEPEGRTQANIYNPPQKSGPKGRRQKAGGFGTDFWGGFERKLQKKVHNGSENSENKKKYGVAEKSVKKCHDLEPNGIGHNSG